MMVATSYLFTYYVYDDFDNLRAVIPPEAVRELDNGATLRHFSKKWLFSYKYDHRQRMVEKQVPGADPMKMWYDYQRPGGADSRWQPGARPMNIPLPSTMPLTGR